MNLLAFLLWVAAVLGDTVNYAVGRHFGMRLFRDPDSRVFRRDYLERTQRFYAKYGAKTIVIARFVPIVRTFAPFVAGVAQMTRSRFTFFDVLGGALWVGGIITVGYFFGNIPWVKLHLDKIIWAMILVPGLVVLYGAWRGHKKTA